jgi:hypothetical protein
MSEVILVFDSPILEGRDGRTYRAQACGRERDTGGWEGWLEFVPFDGSAPVVSERETTQPDREKVRYWATGLTGAYLDGALTRALSPSPPPKPKSPDVAPAADGPRPHSRAADPAATGIEKPIAVLDPFHVYAEGDDLLRRQLAALSAHQLRNIIKAYRMSDDPAVVIDRMNAHELIGIIMLEVERKAGRG